MAGGNTTKDYDSKTRISMKDPDEIAYWRERVCCFAPGPLGRNQGHGFYRVKKIEAYLKSRAKVTGGVSSSATPMSV